MRYVSGRGALLTLVVGLALAQAACSTRSVNRAPVEDRSAQGAPAPAPTVEAQPNAGKPLPGIENAGRAGYYTVKPGDTLIRVGLETGQNWRDIARWNGLENPNVIEVGQTLRVIPPMGATPVPAAAVVVARPVTSTPVNAAPVAPVAAAPAPSPVSASSAPPAVVAAAPLAIPPVASEDEISWMWPARGPVVGSFDEAKNKGLDIAGALGDPVLAAADGRVVYVGAGLRGYGNLIIVKHNATYLTAYAHNQTLLVKEDQTVRRGQKIAEMGNSDADRVKLHFEVRRQGKPVDPARYLPPR